MDDANLFFVFEHCMYGTLSNLITIKGICIIIYLFRQTKRRAIKNLHCDDCKRIKMHALSVNNA